MMEKSISFLLGAGFSAPMGYPVGNQLNEKLLKLKREDFGVGGDGKIYSGNANPHPFLDASYLLLIDLIEYYCREVDGPEHFDYEKFYDFVLRDAKQKADLYSLANTYSEELSSETKLKREFEKLLNQIARPYGNQQILNQLVHHFIKDGKGRRYYENYPLNESEIKKYRGLLDYLKRVSDIGLVDVHTLNHDLLFEGLCTHELSDRLSDGFEREGSPYYGCNHGYIHNDITVNHEQLGCYTGKYDRPIRLYKLHGSFNYAPYFTAKAGTTYLEPDTYVKISEQVDVSELKKEERRNDGSSYIEKYSANSLPDYLTGTDSKIPRCKEPLLYEKLFEHLEKNLQQAEKLIIIGYGGGDRKVSDMIKEKFDHRDKPCIIIDPYAEEGSAIWQLKEELGAILIKKQLENITMNDLEQSEMTDIY